MFVILFVTNNLIFMFGQVVSVAATINDLSFSNMLHALPAARWPFKTLCSTIFCCVLNFQLSFCSFSFFAESSFFRLSLWLRRVTRPVNK